MQCKMLGNDEASCKLFNVDFADVKNKYDNVCSWFSKLLEIPPFKNAETTVMTEGAMKVRLKICSSKKHSSHISRVVLCCVMLNVILLTCVSYHYINCGADIGQFVKDQHKLSLF